MRGGEGDAVAALAGFEAERDREVGLAGAGRAEKADVAALLDPGQLRQVEHERLLGGGLRGPVEVLERLQRGEGGVPDAHARAGGVAREDLGLEQRLEETLVGPPCSRASAAVCSSRSSTRGAFSFESRYGSRSRPSPCSRAELRVVGQLGRRDRRRGSGRAAARPAARPHDRRRQPEALLVAARVAGDLDAAVDDPDLVAVEAELDPLVHEPLRAR